MNTKEEIKALRAKLNELEQRVIEEEKPKRRRVAESDMVYFVDVHGVVCNYYEDYSTYTNNLFACGNYFRTKEEAKQSNIYKVLSYEYEYWFAGVSELPKELPEDCEYFHLNEWLKEGCAPNIWCNYSRRWRRK